MNQRIGKLYDEELEGVEVTRAEKVLAVALTIFLLIGGSWVLNRLETIPSRPDYQAVSDRFNLSALRATVESLNADLSRAEALLAETRNQVDGARMDYEFRREEYRTALEAGTDSAGKKQAYQQSLAALRVAEGKLAAAEAVRESKSRELMGPGAALAAAEAEFSRTMDTAERGFQLRLFLLRFGYAAPAFGLATLVWSRLRQRRNRHLIVATAFLAFSALQLLFVAGIYAWHLLRDVATIAVSVFGSVVSIMGLMALRRHIFSFERVARNRVRRGQCPFCGFPADPTMPFCRECGRPLKERCPACSAPRPVLSPHCPTCGADGGRDGLAATHSSASPEV